MIKYLYAQYADLLEDFKIKGLKESAISKYF